MKITFLGAAHEVTGSCTFLEVGDKKGVVDYGMENFGFKRSLVERSVQVVVAIDHSKFGQTAHCVTCPTERIHTIVTDSDAPEHYLSVLRNAGVKVLIAQNY